MSEAQDAYDDLALRLAASHDAVKGQMFGKPCIKINGKAAIAFFQDCVVFKLPSQTLPEALQIQDAKLWDPSGKGRAMKEWVQVPMHGHADFETLSIAAANYVSLD